MIYIVNKRTKLENIIKKYPNAKIVDVTSTSAEEYSRKLSPFYPHGGIPIPFTPNLYATCVEAVWQGLKVFKNADVDFDMFNNDTMQNIKRTSRKFGEPIGHRKGAYGKELLNYYDARVMIYLPTFKWVLENVDSVQKVIQRFKARYQDLDFVLLDYNTNEDYQNLKKPLSHAALIKLYIEDRYPL